MGLSIDENRMISDNIFAYEEKLKSPVVRYQETTPVYVIYYHINSDVSTTDEGFKDVASIIGFRSPLRYNKIDGLPLYDMDSVVLQLNDEDQGLDSDFTSDAKILPNTIKPTANDFFIIPTLHDAYLFRVTSIAYDTVMPDNFYKIEYKLEYIDQEMINQLEKQVTGSYICNMDNIGSENKCIIESEAYKRLEKLNELYDDMVNTYLTLFYDERHNSLLGEVNGPWLRLYDPLQTEFINKHNLFNKKRDYKTIVLTEQFPDSKRKIKYEKSVYRFLERRDSTLVNNFKYTTTSCTVYQDSTFARWYDKTVKMVENMPYQMPESAYNIFSDEFVSAIRNNDDTQSAHGELIKKFVRREPLTIKDIPLDLNEELINLNASLEVFFITPMILYIIQVLMNEELEEKK